MKTLKKNACIVITLAIILLLPACHRSKTPEEDPNANAEHTTHIITVSAQPQSNTLYFTSTVAPLEVVNVPSPVDGVIDHVYFHYGQRVKKGDLLASVRSDSLMQQYQSALSSYLQAKDQYQSAQQQAQASTELFKSGLVSRNSNDSAQRSMADGYLSYMQAKINLENMLQNAGGFLGTEQDLTDLSLEDKKAVTSAFSVHLNELKLRAPTYGVILLPTQNNNAPAANGTVSNQSGQLLTSGVGVKKNDTVVSIGDLSGISLSISVNEIDINNIKPSQPVSVTGIAFPNLKLNGFVSSIDVQASSNPNGGLPVFPVAVIIPNISEEAQKIIHIGMTSKIALTIQLPPTISVPLSAVTLKEGQPVVMRINPKTEKPEPVVVGTGQTSMNSVLITSGLANGDKILVAD